MPKTVAARDACVRSGAGGFQVIKEERNRNPVKDLGHPSSF